MNITKKGAIPIFSPKGKQFHCDYCQLQATLDGDYDVHSVQELSFRKVLYVRCPTCQNIGCLYIEMERWTKGDMRAFSEWLARFLEDRGAS